MLTIMAPTLAQTKHKNHGEMRKEVQEFKMKYLAQEMDLKSDQQKKFIEVYSKMNEEKSKVVKETRALEKKLAANPDASDEEYEKVSKAITEAKEKDAEISKKYDKEFSSFLSSKQIFKMKSAEEQFRKKMHEMRHKRQASKNSSKEVKKK